MSSFQQTIIIGNVGRDAEWKTTQNGEGFTTFSVAVSEQWTDRNGTKRERTNWYRVTAWGKLAEICQQYVSKGKSLMVIGNVTASAYLNKAGEAQASLELRADRVTFLGGRESAGVREETEAELERVFGSNDEIPF